jgi:hypothetical protein
MIHHVTAGGVEHGRAGGARQVAQKEERGLRVNITG